MKNLVLITALSVFAFSCKDKIQVVQPDVSSNNMAASARVGLDAQENNDGPFELGEKLVNPYSLKNMEMALKELQKINVAFKAIKLEASHDYVRIEASDEASFYAIQTRKDIDLFRYPLDYEVKKSGNSYKEKDYTGKYQVFWAAVPVGYVFDKNLKVKVLEKLFLPKGNGNDNVVVKKSSIAESLLDALEDKSLTMFDPKYTGGKKNGRAAAYYPSGTVRVWDDYLNAYVPVENVEIKARANFTTITTTTGGNGYYYINYANKGLEI